MHNAYLRKVDGSVILVTAPEFLAERDLRADAVVDVELVGGQLVVEHKPPSRHTLAELLAGCDPDAPDPEGDSLFTGGGDRVGGELV
jgi:hypothetical protein